MKRDYLIGAAVAVALSLLFGFTGRADLQEAERQLIEAHVTVSEADTVEPLPPYTRVVHLPITERECE